MNTTDQGQGEEARNYEEVTTTAAPMDETSVDETSVDETSVDETSVDETSVDEPEQDEPEQDEPEQDEPEQDEPKQDEPKQDEPKQDEPKQDEPEQKPADMKRPFSLAELGVGVAPAAPSHSSNEIRANWSMGLVPTKKKQGRHEIRMGTRAQWIAVIKKHSQTLMAYHKRAALTANEVLAALKGNDLMIYDVEHANGIGDALGAYGLHLPVIVNSGPKHYYLPAANMTAEERAEFDALPVIDKVRLIREANASLMGDDA